MAAVSPGPGRRLLLAHDVVRDTDEWTVDTYLGWGHARQADVGLTLAAARRGAPWRDHMYYRRLQVTEVLALCGCGQHDIDTNDDPYAQHRAWVEETNDGEHNTD